MKRKKHTIFIFTKKKTTKKTAGYFRE